MYKVQIPSLAPGEKIPLVISTAYVDCLIPYPAIVAQDAKQYLLYSGEKYTPTLYPTLKQKTKIKSSSIKISVADGRMSGMIESYTQGEPNIDGQPDPTKSGTTLTYGPYGEIPPTTTDIPKIKVHYEYTTPITYVEHLERDIEVSHWGSNLAIEERYKLTNHAAK